MKIIKFHPKEVPLDIEAVDPSLLAGKFSKVFIRREE